MFLEGSASNHGTFDAKGKSDRSVFGRGHAQGGIGGQNENGDIYTIEGPAVSELRVSDNGVTNHNTGDSRNVYDWVEIPRGKYHELIGSGKNMRVVGVGSQHLQKRGTTDFNVKLPGVHVTEGLGFIHFSVHDGQSREKITSDQFYNCLIFPRDETGSHLYATRLDPTPQTLADVPAM